MVSIFSEIALLTERESFQNALSYEHLAALRP